MIDDDTDNDFSIEISEMSESELEVQPDLEFDEYEFYVQDLIRWFEDSINEEDFEEEIPEFNWDEEIDNRMNNSDNGEIDKFEVYHQHKIEEFQLNNESNNEWNWQHQIHNRKNNSDSDAKTDSAKNLIEALYNNLLEFPLDIITIIIDYVYSYHCRNTHCRRIYIADDFSNDRDFDSLGDFSANVISFLAGDFRAACGCSAVVVLGSHVNCPDCDKLISVMIRASVGYFLGDRFDRSKSELFSQVSPYDCQLVEPYCEESVEFKSFNKILYQL